MFYEISSSRKFMNVSLKSYNKNMKSKVVIYIYMYFKISFSFAKQIWHQSAVKFIIYLLNFTSKFFARGFNSSIISSSRKFLFSKFAQVKIQGCKICQPHELLSSLTHKMKMNRYVSYFAIYYHLINIQNLNIKMRDILYKKFIPAETFIPLYENLRIKHLRYSSTNWKEFKEFKELTLERTIFSNCKS